MVTVCASSTAATGRVSTPRTSMTGQVDSMNVARYAASSGGSSDTLYSSRNSMSAVSFAHWQLRQPGAPEDISTAKPQHELGQSGRNALDPYNDRAVDVDQRVQSVLTIRRSHDTAIIMLP